MKVECTCDVCGKVFLKNKGHANWTKKHNKKYCCSKLCIKNLMTTSIDANCKNCGTQIKVLNNIFKRSKTKNFFCNHSCSASYSNTNRKHSEETKRKIGEALSKTSERLILTGVKKCKREILQCAVCKSQFVRLNDRSKYCTKKCDYIAKSGVLPLTREEIISRIIHINNITGLTPQKIQVEKRLYSAAVRFFGTWNKAMKEIGLKPNHSKYQKVRLKCKSGNTSDSISEYIIDNLLFDNGFVCEKNKLYPDNSGRTCDFYITKYNLWIEYFGLYGGDKKYDLMAEDKKKHFIDNKINFIDLYPSDLYPVNNVLDKIKKFTDVF